MNWRPPGGLARKTYRREVGAVAREATKHCKSFHATVDKNRIGGELRSPPRAKGNDYILRTSKWRSNPFLCHYSLATAITAALP
jgi:hypothetical protein